jgi:hypothetical protein
VTPITGAQSAYPITRSLGLLQYFTILTKNALNLSIFS